MSEPEHPRHFCPGCGQRLRLFARYPWYFCQDCLGRAADAQGRKLVFGNVSMSGGLSWAYADDPSKRDDTALEVICLIDGRPVTVGEARFGGVVAEPVNSASPLPATKHRAVLTGGPATNEARGRLLPAGT